MEATIRKKTSTGRRKTLSSYKSKIGKRMSLAEFLQYDPEIPGVKLEWNNGEIEIEYRMKIDERKIIYNIVMKHLQTNDFKTTGNMIMAEADINLPFVETYRRPDASYLTRQQIEDPENAPQVPAFLIEVISPSNAAEEVEKKLEEYFRAGVQVLWIIYPKTRRIHVYTGVKSVQICSDADVCSVAPAVPELQLTVNEIFA